MFDEVYGPEPDRRQRRRRSEDEDLDNTIESLNFAVFGHPRYPETGLMARHSAVERKIDRLTWAAGTAAVSFLATLVTVIFAFVLN